MTRSGSAIPRKDQATGTWSFVLDIGTAPDGRRRQAKRRGFPTKRAAQEELDRTAPGRATNPYVRAADEDGQRVL